MNAIRAAVVAACLLLPLPVNAQQNVSCGPVEAFVSAAEDAATQIGGKWVHLQGEEARRWVANASEGQADPAKFDGVLIVAFPTGDVAFALVLEGGLIACTAPGWTLGADRAERAMAAAKGEGV